MEEKISQGEKRTRQNKLLMKRICQKSILIKFFLHDQFQPLNITPPHDKRVTYQYFLNIFFLRKSITYYQFGKIMQKNKTKYCEQPYYLVILETSSLYY